MKIWHQSFTVLEDLPAYAKLMEEHIRKVVHADTQVELHGLLPGTYPSNYPGNDLAFGSLYSLHALQWIVQGLKAQREGYDAYAMCTLPNPMIREIRTLVDVPVVGYGEASFHVACMLGQRFGLLTFIDGFVPLMKEQIANYGLSARCGAVRPAGFTFQDVLAAFDNPAKLIERFKESARAMIKDGVDVIVPGEMPLNILLASNRVTEVDGVPIIDGLAVTIKLAEAFADLQRTIGFKQTRHGWLGASPDHARVDQVLDFYGLGKLPS